MPTTTTGSTNIAVLDSRIIADMCIGKFYIDLTPSIWIGSGDNNVIGANVQITNPFGVVVKPYGPDYEIAPVLSAGMDTVINFNIPTQASNYQYGKYQISVKLFDAGGTEYTITKTVSLCEPDKNNKAKSYGSLSATMKSSCKDGKVYIITDTPPNYNGKQYESQVLDLELEFPTGSGVDTIETSIGSFSVQLYEGVYKLTGTNCVNYDFGDNVEVKVNYKIKKEKNIRCLIDECCVFTKLSELNLKLKTNCTLAEQETTVSIIVDSLRLLKMVQLAADCGEDASDYINDLEKLLGCQCYCNCAEGTPIINTNPNKDFNITGCNITKTTVGLTDSYVIENYDYIVGVVDNGGAMVVSSAVLNGCTKKQTITFNIEVVYAQIKTQINSNLTYWTTLINTILNTGNVNAFNSVLNSVAACCNCTAMVTGVVAEKVGADVHITWSDTGEYLVDIYLDGVFMGTVMSTIDEFTFEGAADGEEHSYILIPRCSNNKFGTPATGEFAELGCPSISAPVVSSNNVNGVECPYDLTSLESVPPVGITYEWHTANNTNSSSLVPDATNVSSGVYYAFAKDADGCYSTATIVTLVCSEAGSCTAPQNLLVTNSVGGFLVQFKSAASPPPSNSYTVKRRLKSDPDTDPSYTTIGTPVWNAGTSRWEILDATGSNNVLYTYKAISNCGGSPVTTPSTTYDFANLSCPSLTLVPGGDEIDYSFTNVGGSVDKYDIKLYDATGVTLLHTDTHIPAFPNPITGTFSYLSAGTTYKIRVRVYIGSYYKDCTFITTATITESSDPLYYDFYLATQYDCNDCGGTPLATNVPVCFPTGTSVTIGKFYRSNLMEDNTSYEITNTSTDAVSLILATTTYNSCALACSIV